MNETSPFLLGREGVFEYGPLTLSDGTYRSHQTEAKQVWVCSVHGSLIYAILRSRMEAKSHRSVINALICYPFSSNIQESQNPSNQYALNSHLHKLFIS